MRHVYLGEHCLPFRMLEAAEAVIPFDVRAKATLSGDDERIDQFPGLAEWWRGSELTWNEHRRTDKRTLSEQVGYMK